MAGGSAIRGSRVGAGPMGEAERGEAAPRQRITYFCAHGHETAPMFALDAPIPDNWDCPRCGLPGQPGLRQPAAAAEGRAVQDPPRVREGAPVRRRGAGDPGRGAADAARQAQVRRDHLLSSRRPQLTTKSGSSRSAEEPDFVRRVAAATSPRSAAARTTPRTSGRPTQIRIVTPRWAQFEPDISWLNSGWLAVPRSTHGAAEFSALIDVEEDRPGDRQDVVQHDGRGRAHEQHAERETLHDADDLAERDLSRPSQPGSSRSPSRLAAPSPARCRPRRGAKASATAARPSSTIAMNLAATTRTRLGSSVNVTRPVRCDHSLVIARMPSTGSRKPCGVPVTATKLSKVRSDLVAGEQEDDDDRRREQPDRDEQPPAGPGVDDLAQLDPDQPGERHPGVVSSLRSAGGLAWWRSCRCLLSGVVCGELKEHGLEAGALGGSKLGEHDLVGHRGAADLLRARLDDERVAPVVGVR